jgi:hypothetical protein
MTSVALYQHIKDALVKQRAEISASPKAATKLINDLGIRDLVKPATPKSDAKKPGHKRSTNK